MLLYFCDRCGTKVSEAELQQGAVRDGIKTYCAACMTQSGLKRAAQKTTAKAAPVSSRHMRVEGAAQYASAKPSSSAAIYGIVGGVAGVIGIVLALIATKKPPEKVAEPKPEIVETKSAVQPAPPPAVEKPVVKIDPPTPPPIDLSKRGTSTTAENTPELSRSEREKALERELDEMRAKSGAKIMEDARQLWNGRPDVKPIFDQYKKLDEYLEHPPSEIVAAQTEWERKIAQSAVWSVLDPQELASSGGSTLQKGADNVIKAGGNNPVKDTYTITATTELKEIAGLRLEALADPSLPNGGPGRAFNGNFVLTGVKISAAPKGKPAEMKELKIISASSDYDQPTFPASSLAQNPVQNGWAVDQKLGKSHLAVFNLEPAKFETSAALSVVLEFQSVHINHTLGMLRLALTPTPGANAFSPEALSAAQAAPDSRTPEQKKILAAYFRDISPELKKTCDEITKLYGQLDSLRECRRKIATLMGTYRGTQPSKDAAAFLESGKDVFQMLEAVALPARP